MWWLSKGHTWLRGRAGLKSGFSEALVGCSSWFKNPEVWAPILVPSLPLGCQGEDRLFPWAGRLRRALEDQCWNIDLFVTEPGRDCPGMEGQLGRKSQGRGGENPRKGAPLTQKQISLQFQKFQMKELWKGRKYLSGKCWNFSGYIKLGLNEMHVCAVSSVSPGPFIHSPVTTERHLVTLCSLLAHCLSSINSHCGYASKYSITDIVYYYNKF